MEARPSLAIFSPAGQSRTRAQGGCVWRVGSSGGRHHAPLLCLPPPGTPQILGGCLPLLTDLSAGPRKPRQHPHPAPRGLAGAGVSEGPGYALLGPRHFYVPVSRPRCPVPPITRCQSACVECPGSFQKCRSTLPSQGPSRGLPIRLPHIDPGWAGLGNRLRRVRQPGGSREAMARAWLGTAPKTAWGFPFLVCREQGSSMGAGTRPPLFVTKGGWWKRGGRESREP